MKVIPETRCTHKIKYLRVQSYMFQSILIVLNLIVKFLITHTKDLVY